MWHINKLRKDAERLDHFLSYLEGKLRMCSLRVYVCVSVCGGEARGHQRLYQVLWIKERKVNQTLVRSPFQW